MFKIIHKENVSIKSLFSHQRSEQVKAVSTPVVRGKTCKCTDAVALTSLWTEHPRILTAIHINTCGYATCSITPAAMLDSSKYGRGNCHGNSRQKGCRLVRDDLQRVSLTFSSNYCFCNSFKHIVFL